MNEQTNERTNKRTNERTNKQTNESPSVFYRTSSPSGSLPKKWKNMHFRPCPPIRDWYWPCIRPCSFKFSPFPSFFHRLSFFFLFSFSFSFVFLFLSLNKLVSDKFGVPTKGTAMAVVAVPSPTPLSEYLPKTVGQTDIRLYERH